MPGAVEALKGRLPALDVVEQAIRLVEADGSVRYVGRGGDTNLLGEVECDAAIMDGSTLEAGSVGALKDYLHAITVARRVMDRLPHVMVVGDGAARFASEIGAERADMVTKEARARFQRWLEERVPPEVLTRWPDVPLSEHAWPSVDSPESKGTVVYLVADARHDIAAGTSTSGWPYKYPGRIGDSPMIGAGLYAHNSWGACACTHTGEMAIRANTASSVVRYMEQGASVKDACSEAIDDLRELRGGYLGAVVIHAMDRDCDSYVVSTSADVSDKYWMWRDGMPGIVSREPEIVSL